MQHFGSKYLACRPPPLGGQKVKIQLFRNMVMLLNKLKVMEHRAHASHVLFLQGKKNILNVVMLHIKFKRGKKYGLT